VTDEDIQVVRDDGAGRYEARLDGQVAGFADFEAAADRIIFTHTEVDSAFEHRGVASRLIGDALDDVRSRGLTVTARCPFVAAFIRDHAEYADLVVPDQPT
jgi:predicted GNAT family acetyltransferase